MDGTTNGLLIGNIKQEPQDEPAYNANGSLVDNQRVSVKIEPRPNTAVPDTQNDTINWPEEDVKNLLDKIETVLPADDMMAFNTRVEKLNWQEITFKNYSAEDCKKTWLLIQKNIRRYRLLREMVKDAREWMSKPWKDRKRKKYPGMPKKPPSAYILFYKERKDQYITEHPGCDLAEVSKHLSQFYKTLPAEEKMTYENIAAAQRRTYKNQLAEFFQNHSNLNNSQSPQSSNGSSEQTSNRKKPPKKPPTPYALWFKDQLKNRDPQVDIVAFKENSRQRWRDLADTEKIAWINLAIEAENKFKEEVKKYQVKNPGFTPAAFRPILRKEEKLLLEKLAGKPTKPPSSAYSLFSRVMLKSEDYKSVPSKDRLKAIAESWKNYTDEQKRPYQERVNELTEKYKQEYAIYLDRMNAMKTQQDRQATMQKRKIKQEDMPTLELPKKIKKERPEKSESPANKFTPPPPVNPNRPPSVFDAEPPEPPISATALYLQRYRGELSIKEAWAKLATRKKEQFEAEVKAMKQRYIEEYERFLKSLTKDQLLEFAKMKQNRNEEDASGSKDETEESESESEAETKPVIN